MLFCFLDFICISPKDKKRKKKTFKKCFPSFPPSHTLFCTPCFTFCYNSAISWSIIFIFELDRDIDEIILCAKFHHNRMIFFKDYRVNGWTHWPILECTYFLSTQKSERDWLVILECGCIKITLANLFYKRLISIGYCSTNRIWGWIQLRFELFTLIYPKKLVFPITWFLLVTPQPMGFRGEWNTDSSSPPQKTSKYHLCDWKIEL